MIIFKLLHCKWLCTLMDLKETQWQVIKKILNL